MLIDHGAQTDTDLSAPWARIVLDRLVSNTGDPLRNPQVAPSLRIAARDQRLASAFRPAG